MSDITFNIGGAGGAYFMAQPGELVIDIEKRDRDGGNRNTPLQALLVSPDRRVVDRAILEDDGGAEPGEPRRARLTANVEHAGVYALNVTIAHDRYGDQVLWGFATNCENYLVETSRGHRDARHLEPIVLSKPDSPGDVCFLPRPEALEIDVTDLPDAVRALDVFDADGAVVATIPVENGTARHAFEADRGRGNRPWRLHLPAQEAVVHIDGVTRWDRNERFENLSLWSPHITSFFPFHDNRWLLTPYRRTAFTGDSAARELEFRVHNNGPEAVTVALALEAVDGIRPKLSEDRVTLEPDAAHTVILSFDDLASLAAETSFRLRATNEADGFTTWSSVTVKPGDPVFDFEPPLVFKPYEHQNEQAGYLPDYPLENQVYFAPDNTPHIRTDDGVYRLSDGDWSEIDTVDGERYRPVGTKIAFGANGEICLLGRSSAGVAYLYSADGRTFTAAEIPAREGRRQQWDIEQPSGHNVPAGPAPFVRVTETGEYDPRHFWRHVNDIELFLPRVENGRIVVGDPIMLSDKAIGVSSHSGIPSSIVSRGDRVHVIWGEATDPDDKTVPGVPAYIVTYDRNEGLLGEPVCVGYGPPANDVHNTPSVVMDGDGYLHTLSGTHGRPFDYAKSLEPNTAHGGFTTPEHVWEDLRSTYIGFVCDQDNVLHIVFRMWMDDGVHHPVSHYANLAYMRKRPGQPWEAPRRLVVAPFSEYSIFYHRLTIDRRGRLFLSYDYWSTYWFYRTDHHGNRRSLMMSADGGNTWRHVRTQDF